MGQERPITAFFQSSPVSKKRPAPESPIELFSPPRKSRTEIKLTLTPPFPICKKSERINLVLFRNDLRVLDNPALFNASNSDANIVGVYFWSPNTWRRHNLGPPRTDFIQRALVRLSALLWDSWRIPLLIRYVAGTKDMIEVLHALIEEYKVSGIFLNTEYELNEKRRDEKIQEVFGDLVHLYHDQCVVPPDSMQGNLIVYNQVKNRWMSIVQASPEKYLGCTQSPYKNLSFDLIEPDEVPENPFPLLHEQSQIPSLWPVGEEEAHARLELFVKEEVVHYAADRNSPSKDMTSKLSPYIAIGTITARQCINRALRAVHKEAKEIGSIMGGAGKWIAEIIWRDFYRHIMYRHPKVCKYAPFMNYSTHIAWRDSEEDFNAWSHGRTGFPIVDAAMKQLMHTGWMHNRLRMLVASFLSKHLLIDWRRGEKWFSEHLIDIDLANNNGGWQWSSSVGVDPHDWIRVLNPLLQSEKVDPEGEFIKLWLPELRKCGKDSKVIHDPFHRRGEAFVKSIGYTVPIVDHKVSRERAIEAYKRAKEEYEVEEGLRAVPEEGEHSR